MKYNHYLVAGKIRLTTGHVLNYWGEILTQKAITDILEDGDWMDLYSIKDIMNKTVKANKLILAGTPYLKINSVDDTAFTIDIYYPNQTSISGKSGYFIKVFTPIIMKPSTDVILSAAYFPLGTSWHNVIPKATRHVLLLDAGKFLYIEEVSHG